MQEDRDQRDLLGNPQHHLEKIGGPAVKQPPRAARASNHGAGLRVAVRTGVL